MPLKPTKEQLIRSVNVILRIPALFIAEAWYRTDPVEVHQHFHTKSTQFVKDTIPVEHDRFVNELERTHEILIHTVYYLAIFIIVALLALPLKKLVYMYMYMISGGLLIIAHLLSAMYVDEEQEHKGESLLEDTSSIQRLGVNVALQGGITATIAYLIDLKYASRIPFLVYTLPMIARLSGYPVEQLHRIHNFSSIFAILLATFFIFNKIPHVLDFAKTGIQKAVLAIQLYGWIPFFLAVWFNILLPMQFLIFWLILFMLQMFKYYSIHNHPIFHEGWMVVVLASVAECCVTPVSMIGLCIVVSYISFLILSLSKLFLQGWHGYTNDNIMHQGWTEGFTMFLLAVQTGLIDLKASHRAFLMSIVLFIVLSSLIQSMYEIAEPILLALGASQSKHYWKHARAIFLCTILWMFPLYMTRLICQFFDVDFWLMVVISSCVLTSVQVIGSIVIYSLFIYDAVRSHPWENLDDVVYYAKASTRVMEFIVAVFVVLYGVKESLFGEWSWFNSSILIVHCYFNVWQRLQSGWKSYLLRREAVKKIESLPEATAEQINNMDDVCAICIQQLDAQVRITPCRHFFHSICLRKWLYVQENCPMCHQKLQPQNPPHEQSPDDHDASGAAGHTENDHDHTANDHVDNDHADNDHVNNDHIENPHTENTHDVEGMDTQSAQT